MNFPRPTDEELSSMTVNERLIMCNATEPWNNAVLARDRDKMIAVLCGVALTQRQAVETTEAVLRNPAFYAY